MTEPQVAVTCHQRFLAMRLDCNYLNYRVQKSLQRSQGQDLHPSGHGVHQRRQGGPGAGKQRGLSAVPAPVVLLS